MKITSLLLPEEYIEQIEEIADKNLTSKSCILRKAVMEFLKNDSKMGRGT